MGQKSNPIGMRLGVNRTWTSRWFAPKEDYKDLLIGDITIRQYIRKRLSDSDVSTIEILRSPHEIITNIYTSRPGLVIGRGGERIEGLTKEIEHLTGKDIQLNVLEVRKPEIDANLISASVASQIEGRVSYRYASKNAISRAMRMGAKGIKIIISGRLNGAEISRSETFNEGRLPLNTLRADIDYSQTDAHTTYGSVGVKVWVFHEEILGGMHEYWDKNFDKEQKRKR